MRHALRLLAAGALSLMLGAMLTGPPKAGAAEGQLTIGAHITVAPRWLDRAKRNPRSRRSWCFTRFTTRS